MILDPTKALGTIPDWITALGAIAALVLGIYNFITQRRDKHPRFRITVDTRPSKIAQTRYVCRVVNKGSVPAKIVQTRLFLDPAWRWHVRRVLGVRRSVPFPPASLDVEADLEEGEKTTRTEGLARDLWALPCTLNALGDEVLFATGMSNMIHALNAAGYNDPSALVPIRIGVVDALGRAHGVKLKVALRSTSSTRRGV